MEPGIIPKSLPLQAERRITFKTGEGTWISVDASPDGRLLAFDLLGDIYLMPISGGQATRITSGMAFDAQPRFSPDGSELLFVSDRSGSWNIWTINLDDKSLKAVSHERGRMFCSAEWTSDGAAIIATSGTERAGVGDLSNNVIAKYPLSGGTPVILIGSSERGLCFELNSGTLSADGQYLYYSDRVSDGFVSSDDIHQIKRTDVFSGAIEAITAAPGGAVGPVLSHDETVLVYATRLPDGTTGLRTRDLQTSEEHWLVRNVQPDLQGHGRPSLALYPRSAFTMDDDALITSFAGKLWRIEVGSGVVSPIPFEAEIDQLLAPLPLFHHTINDSEGKVRRLRFSQLSPDGDRLAFNAVGRIWIAELATGAVRELTSVEENAIEPAWSPDGRYVAYTTWDEFEGGAIHRRQANGRGSVEKLTARSGFYRDLAYSPDGTRLAFRTILRPSAYRGQFRFPFDETDKLVVGTVPTDGGTIRLIINSAGSARESRTEGGRIHFTEGGKRLHYGGGKFSGGSFSIRLDGSGQRQDVKVRAADIQVSPRGNRALYLTDTMQLYLLDLESSKHSLLDLSETTSWLRSDFRALDQEVPITLISTGGADVIGWSADGKSFYYTLGSTLYQYDLYAFERTINDYEPKTTDVSVEVPTARPTGSLVLHGARVITMRGDEIIDSADVVIEGNRIAAIGQSGTIEIPKNAEVMDVTGKTILPGWIDLHGHLGTSEYLVRAENPQYLAYLAYGVTTVREPAGHIGLWTQSDYADRISAGLQLGPRIFYAGNHHMSFAPAGVRSLADVQDVIRRYSESWRTDLLKQYAHTDRLTRQWMRLAASQQGMLVTSESAGLFSNLTTVADGYNGLEHGMGGITPLHRDVIEFLARSGIVWTPTLCVYNNAHRLSRYDIAEDAKLQYFGVADQYAYRSFSLWRANEKIVSIIASDLAKIVAAGGRVGMGSHGEVRGLGPHWELWNIASGGMNLHDVVRVGTVFGAEALGYAHELGTIEVGKFADLQILERNPLEDIHNTLSIQYVMKNGFLYDADTLDEVWPTHKRMTRWWNSEIETGAVVH